MLETSVWVTSAGSACRNHRRVAGDRATRRGRAGRRSSPRLMLINRAKPSSPSATSSRVRCVRAAVLAHDSRASPGKARSVAVASNGASVERLDVDVDELAPEHFAPERHTFCRRQRRGREPKRYAVRPLRSHHHPEFYRRPVLYHGNGGLPKLRFALLTLLTFAPAQDARGALATVGQGFAGGGSWRTSCASIPSRCPWAARAAVRPRISEAWDGSRCSRAARS